MKFGMILTLLLLTISAAMAQDKQPENFIGGLEEDHEKTGIIQTPVRNNIAQPSEPIVTKRYWKIKKGGFPEFLQVSQQGVWPFFEKIGSRVIGMWLVVHPHETGIDPSPDYDEVYLMTQYASVEHWKATRKMAEMGGNGPDWAKAREALAIRNSLTIETNLEFLRGSNWHNPPYYMPGLGEKYVPAK